MNSITNDYTDVTRYTISAREHDAIANVLWRNEQLRCLVEIFRDKFRALCPEILQQGQVDALSTLLGVVYDHVDMVRECELDLRDLETRANAGRAPRRSLASKTVRRKVSKKKGGAR